ncbi:cupin domain-containing protein [Anaerococcus sp. ENR0831]|uniref:Cupin domain-containing protein n=1 Tax=Anaerococcus martiniensis TaxID=3115615 RepID=A0ABW9M5I2_9FIRM
MILSVKDEFARAHNIYESDSQVVTHLNISANEKIPSHKSTMNVIVVIYEGEVEFTENEDTYNIKPGDIVQMNPNTPHSLKAIIDSKLMVIKSDLK